MRIALRFGLLGIVACSEPAAPAEPDAREWKQPTALRPGPCASVIHGDYARACTMTYGAGDRIDAIDCEISSTLSGGATCETTERWVWVRDAGGAVTTINRSGRECGTALFFYEGLNLGAAITGTHRRSWSNYRSETTSTHEAELVLTRHPFEDQISLLVAAEDALLSTHNEYEQGGDVTITDHTYSYDGPPHQGVRVQTRDDGAQVTFEYDAEGRLIAATGGESPRSYEYDGDRLVRDGDVRYEHDEFGNLVRRTDGEQVTEYDYACWE